MPFKYIDRTGRPNLLLPDGRVAGTLRLNVLSKEMARLKIPGIKGDMGKEDLLDAYEKYVDIFVAQVHATSLPPAPLKTTEHNLMLVRRAVELIQQQAAQ